MDKVRLAFAVCLVVLCAAFSAGFAEHRWPAQVEGYDLDPEVVVVAGDISSN